MSTWKITDRVIDGLASSKLSGALPAVDGSALTGVPGIIKSASDPAIDTNPSGGVGTIWGNTTSGELFACSDATTDENVWTNIGAGTGDVQPYVFQGTISGYNAGGYEGGESPGNIIDKFSLSSDANATDVGDLTQGRGVPAGQTSNTHGYACGGDNPTTTNIIDKFSFSVDSNATDVGDLIAARRAGAGHSMSTHGYYSGGVVSGSYSDVIQKFTFSADANATDVANLTFSRGNVTGTNSATHGYTSGGFTGSSNSNNRDIIDKFTFASDADATDVGDLTTIIRDGAGASSETNGYFSGGYTPPSSNAIQKYSFSSDGNSSSIGTLTEGRHAATGQSSTTHGYSSGGYNAGNKNVIDKFTFASDNNATDVGDLTTSRFGTAGSQK